MRLANAVSVVPEAKSAVVRRLEAWSRDLVETSQRAAE
jgi:hypothetical protein